MARKYEVTAVTGKYTDSTGKEKSRYQTLGSVLETKNGLMLKIESIPVGWDGWAYLNEPKPRDEQQSQPRQAQQRPMQQSSSGFDEMPDDVPF